MWEIIAAKAKFYLPQAADSVLRIVGFKLVGKLIEIPEAWADQRLQSLRDQTDAQSIFSNALAQAASEKAIKNPELVDAMVSSLCEDHGRRLFNKAKTFQLALGHIASEDYDTSSINEDLDDDWLNAFGRICEDASSEKLRDTFSRILAGELSRKGSYSVSTLRVVSELDQSLANTFSEVFSESVAGVIFKNPKYDRSPHWDQINKLRDAGFVSAADSSFHMPSKQGILSNGRALWKVGEDSAHLIIEYDPNVHSEIPIYNLTKMGIEIGTLLPEPDVGKSLRGLAEWNSKKSGWHRITLILPDNVKEILFDTKQNTVEL